MGPVVPTTAPRKTPKPSRDAWGWRHPHLIGPSPDRTRAPEPSPGPAGRELSATGGQPGQQETRSPASGKGLPLRELADRGLGGQGATGRVLREPPHLQERSPE